MSQKRSVVQDVSYCQSGSNVIMVIWKFIKSQLSYFIVGQGKECTYVYFHILYWFQLCFKTLCKRFKHNIKILFGANFVRISKSSQTNYQNKSSSKWWGFLWNEPESWQSMIIKMPFHHWPSPTHYAITICRQQMLPNKPYACTNATTCCFSKYAIKVILKLKCTSHGGMCGKISIASKQWML